MNVHVEVPPGYEQERQWITRVLLAEFLGLECRVTTAQRADVRISLDGQANGPTVTMPDVFFQTPAHDWLTTASLPPEPIDVWDPSSELPEIRQGALPLLYPTATDGGARVTTSAEGLRLECDVFGSAFVMLSRYEECIPGPRDRHGRMRATDSLAWRNNFLERPLVNEYVDVLFALLSRAWRGLARKSWSYRVRPTHDVDFPLITQDRGPVGIAKRVAGDLALRRSPELAFRTARSARRRGEFWFRQDPAYTFDFLMDVSESRGIQSSFYFICDRTEPEYDCDYELDDPWITSLMRSINDRGHRIGLHPSYATWRDPGQVLREFSALRAATDRLGVRQDRWGGRQHYLRWENPTTWRAWDQAGLDYDCTLGFADRVGFRCGVCYPFSAFDLEKRQPLTLVEHPMQMMDTTLFDYMGLSGQTSLDHAVRLADATRRHGGEFQLLWHNTGLLTRAQQRHYLDVMEAVSQ